MYSDSSIITLENRIPAKFELTYETLHMVQVVYCTYKLTRIV